MKANKLYPTKAEMERLENVKRKLNMKEESLTGHVPKKTVKHRIRITV